MDFCQIKERSLKRGSVEVYPDFLVGRSKDLMIRGKSFYAVWDEKSGMWSTDEYRVADIVDEAIYQYRDSIGDRDEHISLRTMKSFNSTSWSNWKNYISKMPDTSYDLDSKLTFSNTKVKKTDYVSKRLPYALEPGDYSAYEELMSTLYIPEERAKIEWAIGSVISGDSKDIQKFMVLYGEAGAGKSTVLNIIQMLFEGYYVAFEAKALASNNNAFSTEVFKNNPLVAIQHDGDLSRIEDNTKINSIVSHEEMVINEKFKASYMARMNCFLFMATNRPVKITDAKSGIIRRLIDVKPSGKKVGTKRYFELWNQIQFQLGAIAAHCLEVFQGMGKNYYSDYRPYEMMYETDVFYNFVEANYDDFARADEIGLKRAYAIYKEYCEDALVEFKLPMYKFRTELKEYFREFYERAKVDGVDVRSLYKGFRKDKFLLEKREEEKREEPASETWLHLDQTVSLFDTEYRDFPAQYATEDGIPKTSWKGVTTHLGDLDTSKEHYVKMPRDHITIDFDLKDETGKKSRELNLAAASRFPPTYAEFSRGGEGIHLEYIYDGDPTMLARVYSEGIEIKVSVGNSSLRRRLSYCNDIPIAHISGGLPLKEKKMVDKVVIKNEKLLREMINRNLRKEIHDATKPSMDFIKKILNDAYASGLSYDVSDMRSRIFSFASKSTHQSDTCMKMVGTLKFKSKDREEATEAVESVAQEQYKDPRLVFYDVEVFPNLFLINWKFEGPDSKVVRMINPAPEEVMALFGYKLVGFNCRRYDNHILYARYLGYDNEDLYELSQAIVSGERGAMFGEAYNISYTDVYDFSSKKQSLKKFEIDLGIHHQELGLQWDKPVDESLWTKVAEYCDNDVIATEAVFNDRKADWLAREILASVAGMTVNDTTNSLTTRIIFGSNSKPQSQFNYRFMGEMRDYETYTTIPNTDPNFTVFDGSKPIFPGYRFEAGKSVYRDEKVGEGGYVYSEPGMYFNVALLDIASMHPSSIVAEELFGPLYTERFNDILQARIAIKHGDFERAKTMLDGKLAPYLEDKAQAKSLAQALKIVINSVYGLTIASFDNPFRDVRNKDNIVAKRGALFMINLKHEVQARGFRVAHIKTDSIKIPNATPEIISFVQEYGRYYGYNFEHEATYDRMCLVNDAVYIARFATVDQCRALYGESYVDDSRDICKENKEEGGQWTATGAQFAQPYVFKTLFSKEPIDIHDMSETKSVTTALYLDMNEKLPEGEHSYQFVGKTGLFCPIQPGYGGGELVREKDGKYSSATGAKGYRWLEYETIQGTGLEEYVDRSYYRRMVDEAVADISKYGDFEMFVTGEVGTMLEVHPPCCSTLYPTCFDCPKYLSGECECFPDIFDKSKKEGN